MMRVTSYWITGLSDQHYLCLPHSQVYQAVWKNCSWVEGDHLAHHCLAENLSQLCPVETLNHQCQAERQNQCCQEEIQSLRYQQETQSLPYQTEMNWQVAERLNLRCRNPQINHSCQAEMQCWWQQLLNLYCQCETFDQQCKTHFHPLRSLIQEVMCWRVVRSVLALERVERCLNYVNSSECVYRRNNLPRSLPLLEWGTQSLLRHQSRCKGTLFLRFVYGMLWSPFRLVSLSVGSTTSASFC